MAGSEERNKAAFRQYVEWWRVGDLERVDEFCTADYVGHVSAGDRDRGGLVERVRVFRSQYPDIIFNFEDQMAEDDRVVTRMTARGTHQPSGNAVILIGINISRIIGDKIAEEWAVWEILKP